MNLLLVCSYLSNLLVFPSPNHHLCAAQTIIFAPASLIFLVAHLCSHLDVTQSIILRHHSSQFFTACIKHQWCLTLIAWCKQSLRASRINDVSPWLLDASNHSALIAWCKQSLLASSIILHKASFFDVTQSIILRPLQANWPSPPPTSKTRNPRP